MNLTEKLRSLVATTLFRSTAMYTFFTVLGSGLNFLLLPFLTRYLSPADFAKSTNFILFSSLITPFITIGMEGLIAVEYSKRSELEMKSLVGTMLTTLLLLIAVSLVALPLASESFHKYLDLDYRWIIAGIICAAFQGVISFAVALARIEDKYLVAALITFFQSLMTTLLSVLMLASLTPNWETRASSQILSSLIIFLFCFHFLIVQNKFRLKFEKDQFRLILKFGLPLIPHLASGLLINSIDRLIMPSKVGLSDAGLYAAGYQVGMIIGVLTGSVNQGYAPWLLKNLDDATETLKLKIVNYTYLYFLSITLLVFAFSLITYFLGDLIFGKSFKESTKFVVWIGLGYGFRGMYQMVGNYLFYVKRTEVLAKVTLFCAILHTSLVFLLVNAYGAIGASYATTITFLAFFVLTWIVSNKCYPMPWIKALKLLVKVRNQ